MLCSNKVKISICFSPFICKMFPSLEKMFYLQALELLALPIYTDDQVGDSLTIDYLSNMMLVY